jgi:hypothetical protein
MVRIAELEAKIGRPVRRDPETVESIGSDDISIVEVGADRGGGDWIGALQRALPEWEKLEDLHFATPLKLTREYIQPPLESYGNEIRYAETDERAKEAAEFLRDLVKGKHGIPPNGISTWGQNLVLRPVPALTPEQQEDIPKGRVRLLWCRAP